MHDCLKLTSFCYEETSAYAKPSLSTCTDKVVTCFTLKVWHAYKWRLKCEHYNAFAFFIYVSLHNAFAGLGYSRKLKQPNAAKFARQVLEVSVKQLHATAQINIYKRRDCMQNKCTIFGGLTLH